MNENENEKIVSEDVGTEPNADVQPEMDTIDMGSPEMSEGTSEISEAVSENTANETSGTDNAVNDSNSSVGNIEQKKDPFAEESFAYDPYHINQPNRPYNNMPYGGQNYQGYNGYNYNNNNGYYGGAQYNPQYSGRPQFNPYNNQTQGYVQSGYQPDNNNSNVYNTNAYDPNIAIEPKKKKLGIGWLILIISMILVIFVLILLIAVALGDDDSADETSKPSYSYEFEPSKPEKADDSSTSVPSQNVTVQIPIQSKPSLEPKYYQDEATGLMTIEGVAQRVCPSVVDIKVYGDNKLVPTSSASGVVLSEDGYIITNAHVTTSAVSGIKVTLDDGSEYSAIIIGQDSKTDLAVLKIEASGLVAADFGSSSDLRTGEMVVAIGNAGGYSDTVTVGYVSSAERKVSVDNYGNSVSCIQTDAALSPGVSGGALVNMYGQVVGITSMKYQLSDLFEGIGFAISMDFAKPVLEDIISKGYISGRVRVGVTYTAITNLDIQNDIAKKFGVSKGLYINTIAEDCDISKTDLQPGDIIIELNGHEVYDAPSILEAEEGLKPGDVIKAKVYRQGITESESSVFEISFRLEQDTNLN